MKALVILRPVSGILLAAILVGVLALWPLRRDIGHLFTPLWAGINNLPVGSLSITFFLMAVVTCALLTAAVVSSARHRALEEMNKRVRRVELLLMPRDNQGLVDELRVDVTRMDAEMAALRAELASLRESVLSGAIVPEPGAEAPAAEEPVAAPAETPIEETPVPEPVAAEEPAPAVEEPMPVAGENEPVIEMEEAQPSVEEIEAEMEEIQASIDASLDEIEEAIEEAHAPADEMEAIEENGETAMVTDLFDPVRETHMEALDALRRGDLTQSETLLRRALDLCEERNESQLSRGIIRYDMARVLARQGDSDQARRPERYASALDELRVSLAATDGEIQFKFMGDLENGGAFQHMAAHPDCEMAILDLMSEIQVA